MVFNATFNNISAILWQLVFFLVEEIGENHRFAASHRLTLSHKVVFRAGFELKNKGNTFFVVVYLTLFYPFCCISGNVNNDATSMELPFVQFCYSFQSSISREEPHKSVNKSHIKKSKSLCYNNETGYIFHDKFRTWNWKRTWCILIIVMFWRKKDLTILRWTFRIEKEKVQELLL